MGSSGKDQSGFTLVEIIVALFIVAFLSASVAVAVGRSSERAAVVAALSEMDAIRDAIQNRFCPDLGTIPRDADHPEAATRFLCLSDDGGTGHPMHDEMRDFLGNEALMAWDRRSERGWRGPYLEPEATYKADDGNRYPVLSDAWGNPYRVFAAEYSDDWATARIVSFGRNRRPDDGSDDGSVYPVPEDIGDDLVVFIFGGGVTRSPLDD